jgi:hypothetical protein
VVTLHRETTPVSRKVSVVERRHPCPQVASFWTFVAELLVREKEFGFQTTRTTRDAPFTSLAA